VRDLKPIQARLNRAQFHYDALHRFVDDALCAGHYGVRRETNVEGSEHTYYAIIAEGFTDGLSLILSDFLHNLRATLDNLVYRLSEAQYRAMGQPVPDKVAESLAFPICDTPENFAKAEERDRLEGLDSDEREVILRHQPYKRFNRARESPLWTLRELQDRDKHRFLLSVRGQRGEWMTSSKPPGYTVTHDYLAGVRDLGSLENDTPLVRFIVSPADPNVDLEYDPNLLVVASDGANGYEDVSALMKRLRYAVDSVVIEAEELP